MSARPAWTTRRGFTLVELMIVVAIVAVLAVLAVVGYRRLLNSSKTSQATHMVQTIRVAQESYHAETGTYAAISSSLKDPNCPAFGPGQRATWDPTCKGDTGTWSTLPIHTDEVLQFKFATTAGIAGAAVPGLPSNMEKTPDLGSSPTTDWFGIVGQGDIDGNGAYCTVVSVSWNTSVYVDGDGE